MAPPQAEQQRTLRFYCCAARERQRKTPVVERVHIAESDGSSTSSDEDDGEFRDLFARPGAEALVLPLPVSCPSNPSDRAAHQRTLEQSFLVAHHIVAVEAETPLLHGRCCLTGLVVVECIRVLAWNAGVTPGHVLFGIHWLTSTSDFACLLCAVPFFVQGTRGTCVHFGCIGPMMTIVFSMCLADVGALAAYLSLATPRPLAGAERSPLAVLEAIFGAWEMVLFASVALQLALCACCWRIYRQLRLTGLYPPGARPMGASKEERVSVLELVCEADDATRISESCHSPTAVCQALLPKHDAEPVAHLPVFERQASNAYERRRPPRMKTPFLTRLTAVQAEGGGVEL